MDTREMMAESRIERKKRETRQKIVKIAMDLFHSQGFDNTTMEQIAEKTDIARKTLYNYFPVKEAIVDEYVRGVSQELAKENFKTIQDLADTKSRLLAALNHSYDWVEKNPEITAICINYRLGSMGKEPGFQSAETGTQSILKKVIKLGQEEGEIKPDVSIELLVRHIDLLRSTMTFEWLNDPSKFELHEEISKLVDLFLYGAASKVDSSKKSDISKGGCLR
ncbi:TetR/AcrR family transcriptional regulator [Clostridium ljungdahlii]|uniref:HTH-type transcriptional repressor KstR2 n=2 Tax=Clostridium ljungdahlii TaxID=1538 RepID=D8GST1_CLOLD|nr:TetR/AcrR family transcriptional regulator [Clostridium ljungdahlii]ADK14501.1 predicted transcriptional regulator [Clostridium ljungdahlii DSM 13528]OAA88080.1 HTH-type transcriptional repressor KstR2 [Clostridium ljungdahlii DSM 13528]